MKKHIITLGGMPGSGKSATGKALAERLGYKRFSSGDFFREMAQRRGITLEELNAHAENDPLIDHETDEWVRDKAQLSNIVIDSRMAYHWIPDAFKVFLRLDPRIAAERTLAHIHAEGRVGQVAESVDNLHHKILGRIESDKKRYSALYGTDYMDESKYDLVVDTGESDLQTVTEEVSAAYERWLQS
jgi:cytidylate kinase